MGLSPTYKETVDVMCTRRTQSHPVTRRTRSQTKVNKTSELSLRVCASFREITVDDDA